MKNCSYCGAKVLMENSRFCWKCGNKFPELPQNKNSHIVGKEQIVSNMRVQLISIEKNKNFSDICRKNCDLEYRKTCFAIKNLCREPSENPALIATVFNLKVINCDSENYGSLQFSAYDTKAKVFKHGHNGGCSHVENDTWIAHSLPPQSITEFSVFFPEFPQDVGVSKFCVSVPNQTVTFEISEFDPEIRAMFYSPNGDKIEDHEKSAAAAREISNRLDFLEITERSLFIPGIDLTDDEKIIPKIEKEFLEIEKLLDHLTNRERAKYQAMLNQNRGAFQKKMYAATAQIEHLKSFIRYVDQLAEIQPRDFEIWCGEFFEILGYTTTITKYSCDGGIDLFLEKDGEIVAVQCKRFARTVSAPAVQGFLGAMVSAGIQKGIFITTSQFSAGAIAICDANNIVRYDKTRIAKTLKDLNLKP